MLLTIEKLVYGGEGLARLPADEHGRGKAAFVPFVLPGEQVEATVTETRPGFVRARLERVERPSQSRVDPPCPYFSACGGCHYQHTGYAEQAAIKEQILVENIRRLARTELPGPPVQHVADPWNYRNRARVRVQAVPEFAAGYYRFGSHALLPVEQCPISSPLVNRGLAALWESGRAREVPAAVEEVEFFANHADELLLVEGTVTPGADETALAAWAEQFRSRLPQAVGVVLFPRDRTPGKDPQAPLVRGARTLDYEVSGIVYRVSAGSFFQVNRHLTAHLVTAVTAGKEGGSVLDMYAGGGLFSVPLARQFERVVAVEPSALSHGDLVANAPATVKSVRATAEEYLKGVADRRRPDVVVVDPPRSGLGERVTRGLVAMGAPRITYVSCDPATLARDLAALLAGGYRIERSHLVDLFPQTFHVETILELVRTL